MEQTIHLTSGEIFLKVVETCMDNGVDLANSPTIHSITIAIIIWITISIMKK